MRERNGKEEGRGRRGERRGEKRREEKERREVWWVTRPERRATSLSVTIVWISSRSFESRGYLNAVRVHRLKRVGWRKWTLKKIVRYRIESELNRPIGNADRRDFSFFEENYRIVEQNTKESWLNEIHWTELRLSMYIIDVRNDSSSMLIICRFTRFFIPVWAILGYQLTLPTRTCINFLHDVSIIRRINVKGRDVSKFPWLFILAYREEFKRKRRRWETDSLEIISRNARVAW